MASARAAVETPVARPRPGRRAQEAAAQPKPKPVTRPRPRARRRSRSRAGIIWIVVGALLLAGVVFVNLAVLQLNLRLDKATQLRNKLRADNAGLQSQLSSALASPRIQALAHNQDGLEQADPSSIVYIDLAKR